MKRRISRIALQRSDDYRLHNLMNDESLSGLEDDPRAMGRFMREMSRQTGEDMDPELDEVADRLVKGESLESIERSMPDLGDFGSTGDDL